MSATILTAGVGLALGTSIGKFLFKHYLGEFAAAAGGGILDFTKDALKDKIRDVRAARKAEREYEQIGEEVVKRIETDLQSAVLGMDEPRPDVDKIADRFNRILSGKLAATFVVRNQIDPQQLTQALRTTAVPGAELFTPAEQKLFDDTASSVAQYLFRAASKLPQFDAARQEESIASLAQLAGEVTEVLDDARAIREQVVSRPLTDEVDFETSYRNTVVAELDKVELFGVDLPPELKDARLTDAYVTLRLRPSDERDDPEDGELEEADADNPDEDDPATLTAEETFDRLQPNAGRLLVRGGAGCGKTTLVRWVAIEAARGTSRERRITPEYERTSDGEIRLLHEKEQEAIAADWRRRMPFVITLRNCTDGKLPKPEEFPAQIGNEVGNPPPQWVQRLLRQGQALILIDGIDEVAKFNHRELFAAVRRFCEAYPKNYVILTTRPDAVADVRFEDLGFVPSEVEPLEERDRELFIRHWFEAVACKLKYTAKQIQELQDEAHTLTRVIGQTPWLAQLATTPLYCAMTCALYRARRGMLPQGLREMCETLCKMMVDQRDRERNVQPVSKAYAELDYQQKKLLLRRLAHYFILAEKSAIPIPDAIEQVGKTLSGMLRRSEREAKEVYDGLVVRSGMLSTAAPARDDRPATVQFVHNTFKEFLAGEQLADEANPEFLVKQLNDETWRRVGLFAISAGNAQYQNAVLQAILNQIPEPLSKERKKKGMTDIEVANTPRGKAIYAYRCGTLGNEWQSEVKNRLKLLMKELFPPKTVAEAEWLASAGNDAISSLLVYPHTNGHVVAACVRALRLIGTPEAIAALRKYKDDTRVNVIRELAQVIQPSECKAVVFTAPKKATISYGWRKHLFDISSLCLPLDITSLDLRFTEVDSVEPLAGFKALQTLDLWGTGVSDLTPLAGLTALQSLSLWGTGVSDLTPLAGLTALQSLHLWGTGVSEEQVDALKKKLPKLTVYGA